MSKPRQTLRTAEAIIAAGLSPPESAADLARVGQRYAVAITPAMSALIDPNDPTDPIARQFVPDVRELDHRPEELTDPIGDNLKSPVKGIVHRYPDRVLLKVVGVCPVYCRFCFRREMVGPELGDNLTRDEIAAALDYVASRPEIWEVILTGGDPFMLSPERAGEITAAISAIPHVGAIRWHTRVPVVAPERVTEAMVSALGTSKALTIGLHVNCARELTREARTAITRLRRANAMLVSQTVLLRGVNDDIATLEELMRALVASGVKPYYLHHADLAPGTTHFRTTIAEGLAIMDALRQRLSGLALPTYVIDIPGAHGKVPLGAGSYRDGPGGPQVRDARGVWHQLVDHCG